MDKYVSTDFKKQYQSCPLTSKYREIRTYGRILYEVDVAEKKKVLITTILDIEYNGIIYKCILCNGTVVQIYDMTNKIEFIESW